MTDIKILQGDECAEFYKWYKFYHPQFPTILGGSFIAVVHNDKECGAGIVVQPIVGGQSCLFSFITRNPFCDRKFSNTAVDILIKNLGTIAKSLGYHSFVSLVGEAPAKARFRKNGIKESSSSLTMFWGEC